MQQPNPIWENWQRPKRIPTILATYIGKFRSSFVVKFMGLVTGATGSTCTFTFSHIFIQTFSFSTYIVPFSAYEGTHKCMHPHCWTFYVPSSNKQIFPEKALLGIQFFLSLQITKTDWNKKGMNCSERSVNCDESCIKVKWMALCEACYTKVNVTPLKSTWLTIEEVWLAMKCKKYWQKDLLFTITELQAFHSYSTLLPDELWKNYAYLLQAISDAVAIEIYIEGFLGLPISRDSCASFYQQAKMVHTARAKLGVWHT